MPVHGKDGANRKSPAPIIEARLKALAGAAPTRTFPIANQRGIRYAGSRALAFITIHQAHFLASSRSASSGFTEALCASKAQNLS